MPHTNTFLKRLIGVCTAALIMLPASHAMAQGVTPPNNGGPSQQGQQPPAPGKGKGDAGDPGGKGKGKGSGSESGKGKGKGKSKGQASEE